MQFLTIKELYNISKVHVVLNNNIAISLNQTNSHKQIKVLGTHEPGRPNTLPHREHILIQQLPLKVQQKPPVRKIKVSKIAPAIHVLIQIRVQYLYEQTHRREVRVHPASLRKIPDHPLHQTLEARVGQLLVVKDDQERRHKVAHALDVADLQVLPRVRVHDVLQLLQVGLLGKVPEVAVTARHVLVNAVHVQRKCADKVLIGQANAPINGGGGNTGFELCFRRRWVMS